MAYREVEVVESKVTSTFVGGRGITGGTASNRTLELTTYRCDQCHALAATSNGQKIPPGTKCGKCKR